MTALSELKDWLWVINTGALLGGFVLINWLRQNFVPKADFKEVCKEVKALDARLSEAENDLEHVPDRDTAHRLELAINRLEGKLETMDERLKPVAAMSHRMQDFLMDEARK
jgi:hypothetical protein